MMPAVPVKMVVGPALGAADRRTPERLAENAADDAANQGAGRPGDDEARSGPGRGSNHVGAGAWRRGDDRGKYGDPQHGITHGCPPKTRGETRIDPRGQPIGLHCRNNMAVDFGDAVDAVEFHEDALS